MLCNFTKWNEVFTKLKPKAITMNTTVMRLEKQ